MIAALYYDRDCSFCSRAVAYLKTGSLAHRVVFLPLQDHQEELQAAGLQGIDSLVLKQDKHCYVYSTAAIKGLVLCRGAQWNLLLIFPRPIRDAVYRWVAKNRHRLFGSESCELPN